MSLKKVGAFVRDWGMTSWAAPRSDEPPCTTQQRPPPQSRQWGWMTSPSRCVRQTCPSCWYCWRYIHAKRCISNTCVRTVGTNMHRSTSGEHCARHAMHLSLSICKLLRANFRGEEIKYVRMCTIVDSGRTRTLAYLVSIKDQCVLRPKIALNGIFRRSLH